jgi:hypothetical protein
MRQRIRNILIEATDGKIPFSRIEKNLRQRIKEELDVGKIQLHIVVFENPDGEGVVFEGDHKRAYDVWNVNFMDKTKIRFPKDCVLEFLVYTDSHDYAVSVLVKNGMIDGVSIDQMK